MTLTQRTDVMSESQMPEKMSKAELEQLIKNNGGKIFQNYDANPNIICIGDRSKDEPKHESSRLLI